MSILITCINPINEVQRVPVTLEHDPIENTENYQSFKMFRDDKWWITREGSPHREEAESVELHRTEDPGIFEVVLRGNSSTCKVGLYTATKYGEIYTF